MVLWVAQERLIWDTKVEEGDIVVSPFFAAAMIGDVGEVELFSVVTSSM